jgi:fido (protein-threonine AMPylation protein)
VLSNNKNKLNGTYVYRHKHNYILCSMFTIMKAQLHVLAINVGHLQVVHEELFNKLYQCVWGVYSLWGGVGAKSRFVLEKRVWTGAV